jgi:hypothetical protein
MEEMVKYRKRSAHGQSEEKVDLEERKQETSGLQAGR